MEVASAFEVEMMVLGFAGLGLLGCRTRKRQVIV
jgi:hypothetical protein